MNDNFKIKGYIQAFKIRDGYKELMYEHHNTIGSWLYSNLRYALIYRSVDVACDAIAWGSYKHIAGSYIDSSYAGTTSTGTIGNLIRTAIGYTQVKFSGTFPFTSQKLINSFQMGDGYTPAGIGVNALFTNIYAYDNSMIAAVNYLTYENGDTLIIDWTLNIGS